MKLIPLSQGLFAKVSDRDYARVRKFKWHAHKAANGKFYARRSVTGSTGKQFTEYLHNFILGIKGVDHKDNDDTLDNMRSNLRPADKSQNNFNRGAPKQNTSGFKGVSRNGKHWKAEIQLHGKNYHLGTFRSAEEAAKAYRYAARKLAGKFAKFE